MTDYGVTETGFVKKTLEDILADLEEKQRARISPILDVSSTEPIGQLNGVFAEAIAEVWDALEAVYKGVDPDQNSGDAQDAVCAITGTTRYGATKSTVVGILTVGANKTIPAGSRASVSGDPSAIFVLDADVVNATGAPVSLPGDFTALETGPVQALAGTLTVIATPVTGWTAVTNAADAVLGRNIESAAALRLRRIQELSASGSSPADAIGADVQRVLKVPCVARVNDTDATVDSIPPHSVEVIVYDDGEIADNVIAAAVWAAKAGGVGTYGNESGTVTDINGDTRTVYFTRPTAIPFEVHVTLTGTGSETLIKEAMLTVAGAYKAGTDVVRARYIAPCFVPGVEDAEVTICVHGGTPGSSNIVIATREIATLDSSDITFA